MMFDTLGSVLARAGIPKGAVDRLNTVFNETLNPPDVRQ